MNPSIFKSYDIRGIYPTDIDESCAYAIGFSTAEILGLTTVAVGRDARASGPSLMKELIRGLTDAGCTVINIGMITTPMLYFSSWQLPVDGALSVTASHNPAEYNGVKICLKNAIPVGEMSGLFDIRDRAFSGNFIPVQKKGSEKTQDIKTDYYEYFGQFAHFKNQKFSLVIDCANTMGVLELPFYEKFQENIKIHPLYCDLDHPYSAHEANPLNTETLKELQEVVVKKKADLGISYDGDADRVGFVDEKGEIIPMDLVTGLIARVLLEKNHGATILYDLRSSDSVKEVIEENGGIAKECRVGHSFIKAQMREENALFAGELSGHYYFQANKNGESSTLAAFTLLNLMAETKLPISELVADLRRYHHSGEINSEVKDKNIVLEELKTVYRQGKISELDGTKIRFSNWWFNVRPSNTEPVLRLNLEAKTKTLMEEKTKEILSIIKKDF
ncbi:MAG: phosphomannomutase/phosphoglucomutase [Candidatus Moraniibacteriota bacterium]|nr:MAG: phosphomannomutase/phosphoglucomutase [Candidatus Moranbacteria bacterium]